MCTFPIFRFVPMQTYIKNKYKCIQTYIYICTHTDILHLQYLFTASAEQQIPRSNPLACGVHVCADAQQKAPVSIVSVYTVHNNILHTVLFAAHLLNSA